MADLPKRNDTDPAAIVARDLRERLSGMQQPELVELCAQLLGTYVIEAVQPLSKAGDGVELQVDTGGDETFAQLLKRLKASKRDPVLERFFIDGENISVRIDGQGVMPITQYRRPVVAPSAPSSGGEAPPPPPPRQSNVPGASTSIYNRGLYEQPAPPPGKPAPAAPSRSAPAPAASATPGKPAPAAPAVAGAKKEEPKDRFSLIELD
jgi:hypothetical protein